MRFRYLVRHPGLPGTPKYMHAYIHTDDHLLRIGMIQRRLAWPLRKDDTHKSRSVNNTSCPGLHFEHQRSLMFTVKSMPGY